MGFQEQMIKMMIDSKTPQELGQIASDMMPQILKRLGPETTAKLMGDILPAMAENMNGVQLEDMMINLLPRMMNTSFSAMDKGQRKFMLKHCRDMLDKMEEKYPAV